MPEIRLRPEQLEAINQTFRYWQDREHSRMFLWNAKPRFGKTITAYHFAAKISAQRILIITNRPAVSNSWIDDFLALAPLPSHILSTNHGSTKHQGRVYSRHELLQSHELLTKPLVYFISMQDAKGKEQNSADFKVANRWVFDAEKPWDLVIVDESHEGIKTTKTRELFKKIRADFWLYLSGTPFRALADEDFGPSQIYNWTYLDEQKSYSAQTPELHFKLCPLSKILSAENFTLSELFQTEEQKFAHEDLVSEWLHRIKPYLHNNVSARSNLVHSFWLLSGVAECRALHQLILSHPDYQDFRVNLVVGKTRDSEKPLQKIRATISDQPNSAQTITISCGQLTTGVTIPEWSQVFMLYDSDDLNRMSVTQYLQAVFRAQNPYHHEDQQKKICEVYDFNPWRALTAIKTYACRLCAPSQAEKDALAEFYKYALIELFTGRIFKKLTPSESTSQLHGGIAKNIVDNKFIFSNELFNFDTIADAPSSTLSILNRVRGVYKNRIETVPLQLLPDPEKLGTSDGNRLERTARHSTLPLKENREHQTPPATMRSHHRSHQTLMTNVRDKLRGLTRCMPILLYLYGEEPQTFPEFIDNISDHDFRQITGIKKEEFNYLKEQGYFHQDNFTFAMVEFMQRIKKCSNFLSSNQSIFDFMSSECTGEIFTPQKVADKMTDRLAVQSPACFQNPKSTFCDPHAKSGTIILSLARQLFLQQRQHYRSDHDCLLHIFTQQIFAFVPNALFQKIVLQTITQAIKKYHFATTELLHIKKNIQVVNPLVKPKGVNMKFDIIVSNPPYQKARHQSYADFYRLAVDLNPELLCMIFPTGWQKPQNHNGLGQLNNAHYKRDPHIVSIDHYYEESAEKLFPEINTGSLNIILRDRNFDNHGQIQKLELGKPAGNMILPISPAEISKPPELTCLISAFELLPKMSALGSSRKPYGFYADPLRDPKKYHLKLQGERRKKDDVRLFGLFSDSTRGYKYISRQSLPKVSKNIDAYKLFVPKAWGNMSERIGLGGSYANICVASPGDVCSETFIEFGPFATRDEAIRMAKYFMTKFFRALLFLAKTSQNAAKDKYKYIPVPDLLPSFWQQQISALDDHLFKLYKVPVNTQKFIKANIQPRDESNIDLL